MTSKIEKYLEKGLVKPKLDRPQKKLAKVVADSKGSYIIDRLRCFDINTTIL